MSYAAWCCAAYGSPFIAWWAPVFHCVASYEPVPPAWPGMSPKSGSVAKLAVV